MDKFEYAILTLGPNPQNPNQQVWMVAPSNLATSNPVLLRVIDELGQACWEAVAIGDLGASAQSEILLKKRLS